MVSSTEKKSIVCQKATGDENVLMDKFQHEVSILLGQHGYDYEVNAIINADEIPICLDKPQKSTLELKGASEVIALNTGSEKYQFTAMMSITSNGMFLLCSFLG